jgi:hypothetical protein
LKRRDAPRALRDDPRLLGDYARLYVKRWYRRAPLRPSRHLAPAAPKATFSWEQGPDLVARAAGAWSEGEAIRVVRRALDGAGDGDGASRAQRLARALAGDPSLGELMYALVRATRPATVIETGVASGVTSAYALAGLEDNGHGQLLSIDLPLPALLVGNLVGSRIPPILRHRWRPAWGDARRLLPAVLRQSRAPRVFIHDSDHGYASMRLELERAWDAFSAGDWLVADDVELHRAFADVAASRGARAFIVAQKDKRTCTGLMQRA